MSHGRPVVLAGAVAALLSLAWPVGCWEWGDFIPGLPTQKHATDDLDEATFDPFLKKHPTVAILFYAPWCFYSQQMMPSWDLAAQKLLLHDPPIHLAKLDAHRYGVIGDRYGVASFPTVKLFADDAVFDYPENMPRGWQQIVKWISGHLERDHVLKSGDDVEHFLHDNDLNVVGLFPDGHNSSTFARIARHHEDVIFAEARGSVVAKDVAVHLAKHASLVCETVDVGDSRVNTKTVDLPREKLECSSTPRNPQRPEWRDAFQATVEGKRVTVKRTDDTGGWLQHLQLKCCDPEPSAASAPKYQISVPSIVMFMPHDERFGIYDGDIEDMHAIDKWISARRQPMIIRYTPETAEKLFQSRSGMMPALYFISQEPVPAVEEVLREAAKKLRGRAMVVFSGLASQMEQRLADVAGVDKDSGPVATLIEAQASHVARKYRLPLAAGASVDAVVDFIAQYEKGSLAPWLKTEPEPSAEDQAMNNVGVLVGTTFTKVAHDESTDVLVDFYAPWCGHCRKFEPQYKELGKRLRHVKSLKIMKIDATRNEIEGLTIQGFPTVLLYRAGKAPKQVVTYHGNREPDDLVQFLVQNCAIKFDPRPPAGLQRPAEDPVGSGLLDPSEEDL